MKNRQAVCFNYGEETELIEAINKEYTLNPTVYADIFEEKNQIKSNIQEQFLTKTTDLHLKLGPTENLFVRVVKPADTEEELPAIFYIHGGGWTAGSFISHDKLIKQLSYLTHSIVIFPSYNLTPKIELETILSECYETIDYFYEHAAEFKIKKNKIAISGDCSGANMATILTILTKENKGPRISFQTLFYPITKSKFKQNEITKFLQSHRLYRQEAECSKELYLEKLCIEKEKYSSPFMTRKEKIKSLPPALLITDTPKHDPEEQSKDTNTFTTKPDILGIKYKGETHGFMAINGIKEPPPAQRAIIQASKVLKAVLHGGI